MAKVATPKDISESIPPDGPDSATNTRADPSASRPRVVRDTHLDWVKFDARIARDGSIDPVDKALYAALASFANAEDRGTEADPDGEDIPTRATLAACIGRSVDTVDRSIKRLETLGLVTVERRRDPENSDSHLPSVYHLRDHEWWDDRAAVRAAARRSASRPGGGRTDAARGSRMGAARGSRTDAARGSRMGAAVLSSSKKSCKNPPPTPQDTGAACVPVAGESAPSARGGEGVPSEHEQQARAVVDAIPAEFELGRKDAQRAAVLVAAALTDGWTGDAILARVTSRDAGGLTNPGRAMVARLENLPSAPPAARAKRAPLPDRCADAQHDPDVPADRMLYDPATGTTRRCPKCHPAASLSGPK